MGPFLIQGRITPPLPGKDAWSCDGFDVSIDGAAVFVGYSEEAQREAAERHFRCYLDAHNFEQDTKRTVAFHVVTKPMASGGQHKSVTLGETLTLTDTASGTVNTATIEGRSHFTSEASIAGRFRVVNPGFDSSLISSAGSRYEKMKRYPELAHAIEHFTHESIDADRPLYGIYKALEELTHAIGEREGIGEGPARKRLAEMAGQVERYVQEVMGTAQVERHRKGKGQRMIPDDECRNRARVLIDAYEASLT